MPIATPDAKNLTGSILFQQIFGAFIIDFGWPMFGTIAAQPISPIMFAKLF